MKKTVITIILLVLVLSCDKYPDPSVKSLRDFSFAFIEEQGSRHFAGEWISDSIQFRAVNNLNPSNDSVKVIFEIVKGGGIVTTTEGYTDKNGYVHTGWKLGNESFDQILRANSYDSHGNFLTSTDMMAYGFTPDEWNAIPYPMEYGINSMTADTVNKITFIATNGNLYKQGDRYYLWNLVPSVSSVKSIAIDRNQVLYLVGWNGDIQRSTDHGESWSFCKKPYPDVNYNLKLYISNDNSIWVSGYLLQTKFSKDGGQTWTSIGGDISTHGFGDIFRLKDGSLLIHGSDCCYMFRSFDEGQTWTRIETPGYSLKLFVTENDEIFIITQQSGMYFYKSTDYGATYSYVYAVHPEWSTSFENTFIKRGNFYYIAVPGYGILKSKDLMNYEIYWENYNMWNLFVDHNGVLISRYFTWNSPDPRLVYYRKNSVQ